MKRDTPQDELFRSTVRNEFLRALSRAQEMGYTVDKFAETLGITRAALHKYTRKQGQSIPSLRVLERARKRWKIRISYGDLGEGYINRKTSADGQLELQFSINDIAKENVQVQRITPKGDSTVEMLLKIDFAKRA